MNSATAQGRDPVLRDLKLLLLRDEHRDLDGLRADVARLDRRIGTEDRFCRAVADSLVVALKVAEIENHQELTAVVAPLVVAGIRREIVESRDLMVETLYPIAGRMVAAAIAAAFRQLSEEINGLLIRWPRRLWLRVKALATGRSYSELLLAELAQGRLERMILIDRGTGAVLATTDGDGAPEDDPGSQLHLIGGLVTAIVEFAGQALSDVNGELRSLDCGGSTVLLRVSPLYIVAGITQAGRSAGRLITTLDEGFLHFLEDPRIGADPGAALAALHASVATRFAPQESGSVAPLAVTATLLATLLVAWIGHAWLAAGQRATQEAALSQIENASDLRDHPLQLAFDRDAGLIRAIGVLPSTQAADDLRRRLATAFPDWPVAARIAVPAEVFAARAGALAAQAEASAAHLAKTDGRLDGLSEGLARIEHDAEALASRQEIEAARAHLASLEARMEKADAERARLATREDVARAETRLGERLNTPTRRLEDIVHRTAIFFGPDATYRDPEAAERDLSALAAALAAVDGARLRIVGYADGTGTGRANLEAARLRATRITTDLEQRGILRARLVVVTSRPPLQITDERITGNRRVIFELVYAAE